MPQPSPASTGRFIVIEGIDGAGTTTQTARLGAALQGRGTKVHTTREPSTGTVGQLLRQILAGAHEPVAPDTLALLFAADRADHLAREIEPALAAGQTVISDRYLHSSLAYQGDGAGPRSEWVLALNAHARRPDLTLFLDLPAPVAAARRAAAGRPDELFDAPSTQERVAAHYHAVIAMLRARGERIDVLDGSAPADAVHAAIVARVLAP
jgi:dTMP kinase